MRAAETCSTLKFSGDVRLGFFLAVIVYPLILIQQPSAAPELLSVAVILGGMANRSRLRLRWHRRA
ncbi:hypothetical protein ACFXJ5_14970 [Streptomyces sp. NPDC059373]